MKLIHPFYKSYSKQKRKEIIAQLSLLNILIPSQMKILYRMIKYANFKFKIIKKETKRSFKKLLIFNKMMYQKSRIKKENK